jgi:hypothetical protein
MIIKALIVTALVVSNAAGMIHLYYRCTCSNWNRNASRLNWIFSISSIIFFLLFVQFVIVNKVHK